MVGVLVCVLFVFCCVTCVLPGLTFGFYSRLAVVCVYGLLLGAFCFGGCWFCLVCLLYCLVLARFGFVVI